jgi:signal-transduction protein with cAMP-binding, CBS, and nucleotidyltransferase domain
VAQKNDGDASMKVAEILELKGQGAYAIKSTETVGNLARKLQQMRVGVMVVSDDGQTINGIISERDIAYSLADRRGELHLLPVSALMTREVITCSPEDNLAEIARLMTKHHIRHLPVQAEGQLVGVVSMRDVLEGRLEEIEKKSKLLMNWLTDRE